MDGQEVKKNGEIFFDRVLEKKTVQIRRLANDRAEEIKFGRWLRHQDVTEKNS